MIAESNEEDSERQKEFASTDEELNLTEGFPANPYTNRGGSRVVCNICQKHIKVSNEQEW